MNRLVLRGCILAASLAVAMSLVLRAAANEGNFGSVTTDPGATQTFIFQPTSNCSAEPPGLVFSDSPENWSPPTFQNQYAVILAQENTAARAVFVDFYGLNKLGASATFVIDVATSGGYAISQPGVRITSDSDYAAEGAYASADFWNNWGSQPEVTPAPGQPAYSAVVPSGDLITGEFEVIQNVNAPMVISVEAFYGPCSPTSCTPIAVGTEKHHSRGIFPDSGVVITPEILQGDYTPRYFDVGTTFAGTCGGALQGHDYTIADIAPVYDVGDYGTIEWFTVAFENLVPSLDWYASPRGGPMTDAFFPVNFFEDNGQYQVCNGTYAVPIPPGPIASPNQAIELGSQDNRFSNTYFEGLVPGGSDTPIRYTYVPSSTGYNVTSCASP